MKYRIIIIILLILTVFLTNYGTNRNQMLSHKINTIFPYEFAEWSGKDIKADNSVFTMLDPDELLLRNYRNLKTGKIINLSIVLTNKRDHIHDPEICYRGQGVDMDKEKYVNLGKEIHAVYVDGKKLSNDYKVIYWYTDLNKTYSSRSKFMKQIILSKILNKPISEFALIIISSTNTNDREMEIFSEHVNSILNNLNSLK